MMAAKNPLSAAFFNRSVTDAVQIERNMAASADWNN
jgi:hypothetical protein